MSNILERIVADKRVYVENSKTMVSYSQLERFFEPEETVNSLKESIRNSSNGIIAEFKRKSPSKGFIKEQAKVEDIVPFYDKMNVAGLSILTDEPYFGGTLFDLKSARRITNTPILRKEFIIDKYQIIEAACYKANAILLIASVLSKKEVKEFSDFAHQLNLDVLLEVHNEAELDHYCDNVDIIGVNNRNLKTFVTDIKQSIELFDKLPKEAVKISESGLSEMSQLDELRSIGYNGFLIGESMMKNILLK